jgi:hypothetical protein
MKTNNICTPTMKTVSTPFSFCPKLLPKLHNVSNYPKIPLMRKAVEKMNAAKSRAVWMRLDLMKQSAVIGRNMVKLYP